MSPKIFSIEGNIGAGKSTLLNLLKIAYNLVNSKSKIYFLTEPVEEWNKLKDNNKNLLEHFYENQERWSYTFQIIALRTRIQGLLKAINNNDDIILMERSVLTDRFCFASNLHDSGKINEIEWSDYLSHFNWLVNDFHIKPDGIIYLDLEPGVCNRRIIERNRTGESNIPMKYLRELHNLHRNWLENTDIPVLKIDASSNFKTDKNVFKNVYNDINNFFEKNCEKNCEKN